MSYDLIFCREKGKPLPFEEVAAWALARKHFRREAPGQIWYENEKTGVYFDPDRYVASWSASNAASVKAILEGEKLEAAFMQESNSLAWWRYMYRHEELSKELEAADVFVPTLFLFALLNSQIAQRAIVWTLDVHLVVPECDLVVLRRTRRGFLGTKEETAVVSFRTVSEMLGSVLEEYDAARGLRIVKPENLSKVQQALANVPFRGAVEKLTRVSPDRVINADIKYSLV